MRPGWTSRAVQLLVRRRIREEIAGDLDELFALRAARDGIQGASCWYCRQAIRAVLTTTLARRTRTAHAGGDSMMQTLVQDVRYGLRLLRKQPAFTVTAIPEGLSPEQLFALTG